MTNLCEFARDIRMGRVTFFVPLHVPIPLYTTEPVHQPPEPTQLNKLLYVARHSTEHLFYSLNAMFDDVCMACGKQLDDGYVLRLMAQSCNSDRLFSSLYCNQICAIADRVNYASTRPRSPSPSSAVTSSVFTSPALAPAGANAPLGISEIPPLVLPKKRTSSSSASSAMTSEFEEDDSLYPTSTLPPLLDIKSEHVYRLPPLGDSDAETTPIAISAKMMPTAVRRTPISALPLNFARRPAPTDMRSMIPPLHVRNGSQVRGANTSTQSKHRHTRSHDLKGLPIPIPAPHLQSLPKRARGSLPAYFSRLTVSNHGSLSLPGIAQVDVQVDASVDVLATPKARSRNVSNTHIGAPQSPASTYSVKKLSQSKEEWKGWDVSPRRSAVPMPVPRTGSTSSERSRGRKGRETGRDVRERVEGAGAERRGRSRIVTTRLMA